MLILHSKYGLKLSLVIVIDGDQSPSNWWSYYLVSGRIYRNHIPFVTSHDDYNGCCIKSV